MIDPEIEDGFDADEYELFEATVMICAGCGSGGFILFQGGNVYCPRCQVIVDGIQTVTSETVFN